MIQRSPIRIARDYNRALWAPVRWAHVAWAAIAAPVVGVAGWLAQPRRRFWALPAVLGAAGLVAVLPNDPPIRKVLGEWSTHLGGDVRRTVEAWQQYGDLMSVLVIGLVILLLDRRGARRLPDLAAAAGLSALAALVIKVCVGRPRPKYDDPFMFLWPGGEYPVAPRDGGTPVLAAAWEPVTRSELWSMPSSHASAAASLSLFVAVMYPPLRWIAVAMVGLVMVGRTMVGAPAPAHWPSDVVVGAALGWLVAGTVMRFSVGCRIADAIGRVPRRVAKHHDTPAHPAKMETDPSHAAAATTRPESESAPIAAGGARST